MGKTRVNETNQAKILKHLEDAEIIQSASTADVAKELIKCAFLTKLSLNVKMVVMLPRIDIMNHVFGMRQSLQDFDLSQLCLAILWTLEGVATLLDSEDRATRRTMRHVKLRCA